MICNNCVRELNRDIVAKTGVSVNCLAFCCENMIKDIEGKLRSGCENEKQQVLDTIAVWMVPNRDHPKVRHYEETRDAHLWISKI